MQRAWLALYLATRRRLRAAGGATPWVTGFAAESPRANYSGWVGLRFVVGASALRVTALGRMMLAGNSQTHTVKLLTAGGAADVTDGSVSLVMTDGVVGEFGYASLTVPVILAAATEYWLLSAETSGGDAWWDSAAAGSGIAISTTDAASALGLAWGSGPGGWASNALPGKCFVPVGFKYSVVAS
jgi:hypothetical protein